MEALARFVVEIIDGLALGNPNETSTDTTSVCRRSILDALSPCGI